MPFLCPTSRLVDPLDLARFLRRAEWRAASETLLKCSMAQLDGHDRPQQLYCGRRRALLNLGLKWRLGWMVK